MAPAMAVPVAISSAAPVLKLVVVHLQSKKSVPVEASVLLMQVLMNSVGVVSAKELSKSAGADPAVEADLARVSNV